MNTVETASAELLTTSQVAKMLNVGERSVWRWSHSYRMPASVRIGNAVRFRRSEILAWIEAGCPRVDGRAGR
jgi:excisionase family DNA binding protein